MSTWDGELLELLYIYHYSNSEKVYNHQRWIGNVLTIILVAYSLLMATERHNVMLELEQEQTFYQPKQFSNVISWWHKPPALQRRLARRHSTDAPGDDARPQHSRQAATATGLTCMHALGRVPACGALLGAHAPWRRRRRILERCPLLGLALVGRRGMPQHAALETNL
jgi:hypothetical protein